MDYKKYAILGNLCDHYISIILVIDLFGIIWNLSLIHFKHAQA